MEQPSGIAIKLIDKIERAHRLAIENLSWHYRYTAGTTTSNKAFDSYSLVSTPKEPAVWGSSHVAHPDYLAEQRRKNQKARDLLDPKESA